MKKLFLLSLFLCSGGSLFSQVTQGDLTGTWRLVALADHREPDKIYTFDFDDAFVAAHAKNTIMRWKDLAGSTEPEDNILFVQDHRNTYYTFNADSNSTYATGQAMDSTYTKLYPQYDDEYLLDYPMPAPDTWALDAATQTLKLIVYLPGSTAEMGTEYKYTLKKEGRFLRLEGTSYSNDPVLYLEKLP